MILACLQILVWPVFYPLYAFYISWVSDGNMIPLHWHTFALRIALTSFYERQFFSCPLQYIGPHTINSRYTLKRLHLIKGYLLLLYCQCYYLLISFHNLKSESQLLNTELCLPSLCMTNQQQWHQDVYVILSEKW